MRKRARGSQMSLEGNPKWKFEKLPVRFSLRKRGGSQMAKVWTIKIAVRLCIVYRHFSRIGPLLTIYHLNTLCRYIV